MPSYRLGRGQVQGTNRPIELLRPDSRGARRAGTWKPDLPFSAEDGLKVTMRAERGLTPSAYLRVPFRFQAPPLDSFNRPSQFRWESYDTLSDGERKRQNGRALDVLNFQTLFVDEHFPWLVWTGAYDPQRFLDELNMIKDAAVRFRLTVSQTALWGPRPLVNMIAALSSVEAEQRAGEIGTEYATLEFSETTRGRLQLTRRPSEADQERRFDLVAGDTLYAIARRAYHEASAWRIIADANGIKGVSPDSADELSAWAKRRNRKSLRIPAYRLRVEQTGVKVSSR